MLIKESKDVLGNVFQDDAVDEGEPFSFDTLSAFKTCVN